MTGPGRRLRVGVLGAGAVGCWVGGMLSVDPEVALTLVGRPAVLRPVAADGLRVESPDDRALVVPPDRFHLTTEPSDLADADVVLVCVKSRDTTTAVADAARHLRPGVAVVSLQNGLHNPDRIRAALADGAADPSVIAGMVPFNVARTGPASYRRATSGTILVAEDPALTRFLEAGSRSGLPLRSHPDLPGVQRAKLLVNMSNAVNALCGLSLRDQLADRALRRVIAVCQQEGLAVLEAEGTPPARLGPLGPRATVAVLRLPTPLFSALARTQLRVDPAARSSMADDLAAGRPTEVGELQGEVVRLGALHDIRTPACARIVELVHRAESRGPADPPRWPGRDLLAAVME